MVLEVSAKHQGLGAEHQRADMYHQKVDVVDCSINL